MKNSFIYLLFLLIGTIVSCKKNDPKPSSPPVVTNTMNSTETALIGKWYIQKTETRDSYNVLINTDTSLYHNKYYMDLQSSVYPSVSGYYNCVVGELTWNTMTFWKASGNTIWAYDITSSSQTIPAQILTLTSTTLIYNYNAGADTLHGGTRYYYKK